MRRRMRLRTPSSEKGAGAPNESLRLGACQLRAEASPATLAGVAAPVRKGEELELRIDSLAYGGNGVARLDGFVVFVRGGLPGDVVRARVTKTKRGFAEATAHAVLEPSGDRVVAPCRHFGVCGGCRAPHTGS